MTRMEATRRDALMCEIKAFSHPPHFQERLMENTNFPSLHSLLLLLGTPPLPAVQVGVKEISRCLICPCLQASNTCLLVVHLAFSNN